MKSSHYCLKQQQVYYNLSFFFVVIIFKILLLQQYRYNHFVSSWIVTIPISSSSHLTSPTKNKFGSTTSSSINNYFIAKNNKGIIQSTNIRSIITAMSSFPSKAATETSAMTTSSLSNHNNPLPKLPIPDPIYSNIPGTWAYDTMSRRVNDEILQRTYEDCYNDIELNDAFKEIKNNFQLLRNELINASTTKLTHLNKPIDYETNIERKKEYDEWYSILDPLIQNNDTWLTAPWLITEFYVYRRLMQVFDYWTPNTIGYMYDPFMKSKRTGLISSVGSAEPMLAKIPNLPKDSIGLGIAVSIALWGNKMDLSLWPADTSNTNIDIFSNILEKSLENLLNDDSILLSEYCNMLRNNGGGNIDIIIDNAGFELITDLALGQYLIDSGIAKCVTYQLKSHPTFVSDALTKDLLETIEYYIIQNVTQYPNTVNAGKTWKNMLQTGKWICNENNFWVQPYPMWDMTEPLRTNIKDRCDLAFVKGDANYRRLLGDRLWNYNDTFNDVVGNYFPCPICALRTLKAELGCGMSIEQTTRASILDKNWMTNGRFGVIQFSMGAGK